MTISNDREMRGALDELSPGEQCLAGAQLIGNVIGICDNSRLNNALEVALNPESSLEQREDAHRSAKSVSVSTYAACGSDADWLKQAEHFIAAACALVLTPESRIAADSNLAWKAAMQARMARNCAMIESGDGDTANEAEAQYEILSRYLAS